MAILVYKNNEELGFGRAPFMWAPLLPEVNAGAMLSGHCDVLGALERKHPPAGVMQAGANV